MPTKPKRKPFKPKKQYEWERKNRIKKTASEIEPSTSKTSCVATPSKTSCVATPFKTSCVATQCESSVANVNCQTDTTKSLDKQCQTDSVPKLPNGYHVMAQNDQTLAVAKFSESDGLYSMIFQVTFKKGTVDLNVRGMPVPYSHELYSFYTSNPDDITAFLSQLDDYSVCVGNSDGEVDVNQPTIVNTKTGEIIGSRHFHTNGCTYRHPHCAVLTKGSRCKPCQNARTILRARKNRKIKTKTPTYHPNTPFSTMSSAQKDSALKSFSDEKRKLKRRNIALEHKVDELKGKIDTLLQESTPVSDNLNEDLLKLHEEATPSIEELFSPGSFQRIFWEEQVKSVSCSKYGMRWHPAIIRWCLYIKSKSSAAYDGMRQFLNLPSENTLYDYSHYTSPDVGIQSSVVEQLIKEGDRLKLYDDEANSYVGIVFDEVKIRSDLVYNKHTGELVGYVNLDSVGNEFLALEDEWLSSKDENSSPSESRNPAKLATSLLVCMVRGATSCLKFPLASFATDSLAGDLLYDIIWKIVLTLEIDCDLKVLFFCADGASANRKFFDIHFTGVQKTKDSCNYYITHILDETRSIYLISDAPHLLKTTRNCLANSMSHKKSRDLWMNGETLSWMKLVDFYVNYCESSVYSICPKLTRAHIDLTPFSKMRVSLAAQILSSSVADGLKFAYGDSCSELIRFISLFDKWFDIMNCSSFEKARTSRNSNKSPFTDSKDIRLDFLEKEFPKFLSDWKSSVENRPGEFSKKERCRMLLSAQTMYGLTMSSLSVAACVRFLLDKGIKFVCTTNFNQDPLEQLFGLLRQCCGPNSNPTVYQALHSVNQMRTVGSMAVAPKRGNTSRGEKHEHVIDDSVLPKKRYKK